MILNPLWIIIQLINWMCGEIVEVKSPNGARFPKLFAYMRRKVNPTTLSRFVFAKTGLD